MLVCEDRDKRSSARRIAAAGFPRTKILADFDFTANPSVPAAVVNQLATCAWGSAAWIACCESRRMVGLSLTLPGA